MNYKKQYELLISTRLKLHQERIYNKKQGAYYEKHHILPKCIGGDNSPTNLLLLTSREHFIAHLLLWKIHGGKLFYAIWLMMQRNTSCCKDVTITSRRFAYLREEQKRLNRKTGKDHWNYGKHHTIKSKQKMREAKLGKPSSRKGIRLTEKTKEKIRIANVNKKLSAAHKQNISNALRVSKHPMMTNTQPFQHMKVKSNKNLQMKWMNAMEIYDVWINNNKPGYVNMQKITKISSLRAMIKWFDKWGNPSKNDTWIDWRKNHTQ